MIATQPLDGLVQHHVFDGETYLFQDKPMALGSLKHHLGSHLNVPERDICVVGSSKLGFSMAPERFPAAIRANSDIDVIVISNELFELVWFTLLRWHYPRRISGLDKSWSDERRRDLYWGLMYPNRIRFQGLTFPEVLKPIRDLGAKWLASFNSLALYPEFSRYRVKGRLYRSWSHAMEYHIDGLRQIREKIREGVL